MAACDLSIPRPLVIKREEVPDYLGQELTIDLICACQCEFAHIQDLRLSKMYVPQRKKDENILIQVL